MLQDPSWGKGASSVWHRKLWQLRRHGVQLVAFVESVRYDEATSTLGVQQPAEGDILCQLDFMGDYEKALLDLLEKEAPVENVPAKVFQTEATWYALLALPVAGNPFKKNYVVISSESVTSPQILQRNTAEILARALSMSSVVRPAAAAAYGWRMRLVCSDRYAAQFVAERMLKEARGAGWHTLHLGCEVHMSTSSQSKGLLLMDSVITRVIRFALSLRLGGWMR